MSSDEQTLDTLNRRIDVALLLKPDADDAAARLLPTLTEAEKAALARRELMHQVQAIFEEAAAKGWLSTTDGETYTLTPAGDAARASGAWDRWAAGRD